MLKLDMIFKGISVPSAIISVEDINISASHETMAFVISCKATYESEAFSTSMYGCAYDVTGLSPVDQAYAYLKTLDEFSTATEL